MTFGSSLYNNIKPPSWLNPGTDFHLFKEGIEPKWEDPQCESGGKWTVLVPKGPVSKATLDMMWLNAVSPSAQFHVPVPSSVREGKEDRSQLSQRSLGMCLCVEMSSYPYSPLGEDVVCVQGVCHAQNRSSPLLCWTGLAVKTRLCLCQTVCYPYFSVALGFRFQHVCHSIAEVVGWSE